VLEDPPAAMPLIVAPQTCWLPDAIAAGARVWGLALQLYAVRSAANWGIGDFGDLREITAQLCADGADVVGLNPLHALFLDDPQHASPYSPSSRLLLNVLNIDVTAVDGFATCAAAQAAVTAPEFRERLAGARRVSLVAYAEVAALKLPVLRLLFAAGGGEP
jgi:(1->4)-alpha-D-glucan 1-alpha-D-glucosylmutase